MQKRSQRYKATSKGQPPWRWCPLLPGLLLLPRCSYLNRKEESGLHKSTSQATGLQRLAPTLSGEDYLVWLSARHQQAVLFYHHWGPETLFQSLEGEKFGCQRLSLPLSPTVGTLQKCPPCFFLNGANKLGLAGESGKKGNLWEFQKVP